MSNPLLQFKAISKSYLSGEKQLLILDEIDFSLYPGSSVAIMGKSGSGKTTFLNIAGALDRPSSGQLYFNEKLINHANERQISLYRNQEVGFVFQSHILLDDFNALENVLIPALIKGESKRSARKRARQLLERVGLAERLTHPPQKLSGGERQRVAICRALMNSPSLIIADEPTGSLDENSSVEIEKLLLELVKEENKSLLLVTHDRQLAQKCDLVYLLQEREIKEIR